MLLRDEAKPKKGGLGYGFIGRNPNGPAEIIWAGLAAQSLAKKKEKKKI